MDTFNHLEPTKWFGEFKTTDGKFTFPGELSYSLSRGARVKYVGEFPPFALRGQKRVTAILESGIRCVLVSTQQEGVFDREGGMRAGLSFGEGVAQAALFFANDADVESLTGFRLSMTGFDSFCQGEVFKSAARKAGFEISPFKVGHRRVSIWRGSRSIFVTNKSLASNLTGTDAQSGKEIELCVKRRDGKKRAFHTLLRQDTYWQLVFEYEAGQPIENLLIDIRNMLTFISHVLQRPVAPIELFAIRTDSDGHPREIPLLLTRLMHSAAEKLARAETSIHRLPLRLSELPFKRMTSKWFALSRSGIFQYMSHQNQSITGIAAAYDAFARIILLGTLLEDANADLGGPPSEKYTRLVSELAEKHVLDELLKISKKSSLLEFGKFFAAVRNELAHEKRPKSTLKTLKESTLFDICDLLELVLFSYTLQLLGVKRSTALLAQARLY